MLFNSSEFAIFFLVVFGLYWLANGRTRMQNGLLLVASYFFYAWWDWRFLGLIFLSTLIDYFCALWLDRTHRKVFLISSVVANLTILGVFKYFNFFADSLETVLNGLGYAPTMTTLQIVLPVGISYYTFQKIGYTIDVSRKKIPPTRDLLAFSVFVAYFPRLVAGPIERAGSLLPALASRRTLDLTRLRTGLWLTFWGLFKKAAVADGLAPIVNGIFDGTTPLNGMNALLGIYAFTIQIYCDFSGYSDIARGISRLLGIELMVNFRRPYFSADPSEFWRRWHISLSTWLRDYLYIPLGGNRHGTLQLYRNLMITMILGGLWHGPTWMFVIWGAFHGAILVVYRVIDSELGWIDFGRLRGIRRTLAAVVMFHLAAFGWLFFRADSMQVVSRFAHAILFDFTMAGDTLRLAVQALSLSLLALLIDAWQEFSDRSDGETAVVGSLRPVWRGILFLLLTIQLAVIGTQGGQAFIYFQF